VYLAQGSNLSPLLLDSFVLVVLFFRVNVQVLLLPLEDLCCPVRDINGFIVFVKKEGLYCEVNDVANAANSVLHGVPRREVLLQNSTELIVAAVVVT